MSDETIKYLNAVNTQQNELIDSLNTRIRELESTLSKARAEAFEQGREVMRAEAAEQLGEDFAKYRRKASAMGVSISSSSEFHFAAQALDRNIAAILALSRSPDWVAVKREPTEAMWGNDLVRALIFWQRTERPTPSKLFLHCKNCGVAVPQWLSDEPEMKNLDHVTSKGTVAVLIYRAMLAQAGKE